MFLFTVSIFFVFYRWASNKHRTNPFPGSAHFSLRNYVSSCSSRRWVVFSKWYLHLASGSPQVRRGHQEMPWIRALQVPDGRLVRPLPAVKELQPLLLPRVHQGVRYRAKTASKAFQGPRIYGWVPFLASLSPFSLPKNEATTISGKRVAYILPKEMGPFVETLEEAWAPSAGPSQRRARDSSTCSPRESLTTTDQQKTKGEWTL